MKKIVFILSILFFVSCYNEPKIEKEPPQRHSIELLTYEDTINYALGVILGENMKQYGINTIDFNLVNSGIADAFSEQKNFIISPEDARRYLAIFLNKKYKQYKTDYIQKNSDFLKQNALRPEVIVTQSGLQYEILKTGNGQKPGINDVVIVNYKGWLIDGTIVGNTFGKKPVKFALNKSIKGWQEALLMMREGDKWRIYLPPSLAFGKKGGKKIKPNSVVIYEIELLKVIKN